MMFGESDDAGVVVALGAAFGVGLVVVAFGEADGAGVSAGVSAEMGERRKNMIRKTLTGSIFCFVFWWWSTTEFCGFKRK